MPMTSFSHMRRSDHSMLPPTPAATIAFNSPNACNICHAHQSPEWADGHVRRWRANDYQAPVLELGQLTDDARKSDWTQLDAMLAVIKDTKRDQVVVTSMIRILQNCPEPRKWPALRVAMANPSPLVRSAAAMQLRDDPASESSSLLLEALSDDFRLVRIAAAASLQRYPRARMSPTDVARFESATEEYKTSMMTQPDRWSSHYNMGNFLSDNGAIDQALKSYKKSHNLRPEMIQPLVNASMLLARQGQTLESIAQLRKALAVAPQHAAVNFNLGLALAEQQDMVGAERCLRQAVQSDPTMAEAAYNLGVLVAGQNPDEGIAWLKKALAVSPGDGKHAYTLAFYLNQKGSVSEAIMVLEKLLAEGTPTANSYLLLASLHESAGNPQAAAAVYRKASGDRTMPASLRRHAQMKLESASE